MSRILMIFAFLGVISGCTSGQTPKGKLLYCRCKTATPCGNSYYELIIENGEIKIIAAGTPSLHLESPSYQPWKEEYTATEKDVETLQKIISDNRIYKLNGYIADQPTTSGKTYRVEIKYDSDEAVVFAWYGHKVKRKVVAAYDKIERFFEQFLQKAQANRQKSYDMQSFYYREWTARNRYAVDNFEVKRAEDGKILVTIDKELPLSGTLEAEPAILEKLQTIITEYKMDRYKGSYYPKMDIRDGSSWDFQVQYADKAKNITAHGTNASPQNYREAFQAISALFESYRNRLWEGAYRGCTKPINHFEKADTCAQGNFPHKLEIYTLQADSTVEVLLTVQSQFCVLLKGIPQHKSLYLYLKEVKEGSLANAENINHDEPLFILYNTLDLQDYQKIKAFGEEVNYLYFKKLF